MLDIAISTFLVIIPVIIIILVGYFSRKRKWITEEGVDSISKFVFYIALPCLLIDEVSRTDISTFFDLKGPIVLAIVAVLVASLGYFSAFLKKLPPSSKGVWAQSAFRGNMAFVGIPITLNAIGDEGLYYCSVMLAVGAPLYNILSIIFLTFPHRKTTQDKKQTLYIISKSIFKNPLTVSVAIGILLSFVRPPEFAILDISLATLKKTTLPLALISIGGQLSFKASFHIMPKIIVPILYKLLLSPLLGGILLFLLNAKSQDFITTVIFLGAPTAIISFVMAREMQGDEKVSLNFILASTLLCFISYSIILFILGILGIWQYKSLL